MTTERQSGPVALGEAYQRVSERMAAAAERSGRRREDVLLVAVTKQASPDQIRTLVELGHADLGESRVQQLQQRAGQLGEFLSRKKTLSGAAPKAAAALPEQVRWHMIGHLQRNKIKQVVPIAQLIHSLDNFRLAEDLHQYATRHEMTVDVLLQINTADEASKFGVTPPAARHLAEQINTMLYLRLRGLMVMAPYSDDPEDARPVFARTAEIFNDIRDEPHAEDHFNILSMGMSGDFEVAIEEGANVVRVGSALFDPASDK